MVNKQQTAVECLEDEINKVLSHLPVEREMIKNLIEQAKQMEKEQMKNAYWYGEYDGHNGSDRNFEQYYNETFKSE